MRKILGYILSVTLVLAMCVNSKAIVKVYAEDTGNVVSNITDPESVTEYSTWEDAISAATPGDKLKALADITSEMNISINVTKSISIDLNQHSVGAINLKESDIDLSVSNGSVSGIYETKGKTGADVILETVNVFSVDIDNQASLKMKDCLCQMGIDAPISNAGDKKNEFINCELKNSIWMSDGSGGKVYISGENSKVSGVAIYRDANAYVQVDGGTVDSIICDKGTVVINNVDSINNISMNDTGTIKLNGGKYTERCRNRLLQFCNDKIVYPEEKRLVKRGEYFELGTPSESDWEVKDATTGYMSWYEAVKETADKSTLYALCDSAELITVTADKTISIDFGNYKYTRGLNVLKGATLNVLGGTYIAGTESSTAEMWTNYGTINIKDGDFQAKIYNMASMQGWSFCVYNYGTLNISGGKMTGASISSREKDGAWGNTYITGGQFADNGFMKFGFYNGNTNETRQHMFISKGQFPMSVKQKVLENLTPGADAVEVDIDESSFAIMTAAEKAEYEANRPTPTPTPSPTPSPTPTATPAVPTPTPTPTPAPAEVGEKVKPTEKDKSGAKYEVTANEGEEATVKVTDGKTAKGKVVIPDTVTDADGNTYAVTEIEKGAYKNNKKITSVSLGENITKVGNDAFKGATKLTKVDLRESQVTEIGKNAFNGDKKLGKIQLNGDNITKVGKDAFKGVKKNCKIEITAKSKKEYNAVVKLIKKSGAKNVKFAYKKAK